MTNSLEKAYDLHHIGRQRLGFSLLEEERAQFFSGVIGTGKRILDLGCRDGTLTRHFTDGNYVTGADIDEHALRIAGERYGIQALHLDIGSCPWDIPDRSFDVVVAGEIIEHLFLPERVLAEIVRVLTPTGMLIGSVPNAFTLKCRLRYLVGKKRGTPLADPMHVNQYEWNEFRRLLERHFPHVRLKPLGKRWSGFRDRFPGLFSYGIGFVARRG